MRLSSAAQTYPQTRPSISPTAAVKQSLKASEAKLGDHSTTREGSTTTAVHPEEMSGLYPAPPGGREPPPPAGSVAKRMPNAGGDDEAEAAEVPGTGNDVPVQEQYAAAQPVSDEIRPEDRQAQPGVFTNDRGNLKVGSCRHEVARETGATTRL